jgi:outer membrane protein OmpA-like peptidoglycan-associated protein
MWRARRCWHITVFFERRLRGNYSICKFIDQNFMWRCSKFERGRKPLSASPVRVQKKLIVNAPGDRHEQEADKMADKITSRPGATPAGHLSQTSLSALDDKGGKGEPNPLVNEVLQSGGHPLNDDSRNFMESRFGYNFSNVRIHDDGKAVKSAESINAKAYTHGSNIVLNKNINHNSAAGHHLLAHELSHVIQQSGGGVANNIVQRQPLSSDKSDLAIPSVDLRDTASPLLASALGSAEISRFKLGGYEVPKEGKDTLRYSAKQIIFFLSKFPRSSVTIKGFTDKVGDGENNMTLGQRRADAVKDFLRQEGVPDEVISIESKGENEPAVQTKDNVPEPRNRRVQVIFNVHKGSVSFGMDLKLRPPEKLTDTPKPPEKPPISLTVPKEPERRIPFRDPDEGSQWKKMEENQRKIEEFDRKNPPKKRSVTDVIIDGVMDTTIKPILKKLPLSKDMREKAEGLIRKGIEAGTEKAIDSVIDALPGDSSEKDALKSAAKGLIKQK